MKLKQKKVKYAVVYLCETTYFLTDPKQLSDFMLYFSYFPDRWEDALGGS